MQSPALQTQALAKRFGAVQAVQDVTLEVQAGQTLALLGPSGCGKSTVLRMIAGLETPDHGEIIMGGRQVTGLPPEARHIGLVFQDYALFPHLNVLENVSYGPRRRGMPPAQAHVRAHEVLGLVGLGQLAKRLPSQLSGGQQQRVALARALATASPLLLLDEPLSNLDEQLRAELRQELHELFRRELFQQQGAGVLLVTHDQREALALAQQVAIMRLGRLVQCGPALEVIQRPVTAWVAAFLGWANILPAPEHTANTKHTALLIPERAIALGAGEPYPVTGQQPAEYGETVQVRHPLGTLTLHLSQREVALIKQQSGGPTLALHLHQQQLLSVPDDRDL